MAKRPPSFITAVVTYGTLSIGEGVAGLGVRMRGDAVTRPKIIAGVMDSKLQVDLLSDPNADDDLPGQQTMGQDDYGEATTFEARVGAVRFSTKWTGFVLKFEITDTEDEQGLAALTKFPKTQGRLRLRRLGPAKPAKPTASDTPAGKEGSA